MSNDFVMDVVGLLELQQKLLALSDEKTMNEIARPVFVKMSKEAQKRMRMRAPRSQQPRRDSKHWWRDGRHAVDKINIEDIKIDSHDEMTQFVGISADDNSPGFYLKFSEFGTSTQPARPWARPVYQEMKSEFVDEMTEALARKLEELEG